MHLKIFVFLCFATQCCLIGFRIYLCLVWCNLCGLVPFSMVRQMRRMRWYLNVCEGEGMVHFGTLFPVLLCSQHFGTTVIWILTVLSMLCIEVRPEVLRTLILSIIWVTITRHIHLSIPLRFHMRAKISYWFKISSNKCLCVSCVLHVWYSGPSGQFDAIVYDIKNQSRTSLARQYQVSDVQPKRRHMPFVRTNGCENWINA